MMKRVWNKVRMFFYLLFSGMAAADSVIFGKGRSDSGDQGAERHIGGGGVFENMLEEKVTKEVEETRDKYYRVYKEADHYDTSTIKMSVDGNGEVSFEHSGRLNRRDVSRFIDKIDVFGQDEIPVRTIQDNRHIQKKSVFVGMTEEFDPEMMPKGLYDYDTTLHIDMNGFIPRFQLEKFVKKMVVRQFDNTDRAVVDLYVNSEASQFGKIDAILISNLHQLKDNPKACVDATDISGMEWYSDKAWNTDDICLFKYDNVIYIGINEYDGNFVLSYDCHIVADGVDLTEKYRTKELDEKYETYSPKKDGIDIFTLNRNLDKEKDSDGLNLDSTTIKIEK